MKKLLSTGMAAALSAILFVTPVFAATPKAANTGKDVPKYTFTVSEIVETKEMSFPKATFPVDGEMTVSEETETVLVNIVKDGADFKFVADEEIFALPAVRIKIGNEPLRKLYGALGTDGFGYLYTNLDVYPDIPMEGKFKLDPEEVPSGTVYFKYMVVGGNDGDNFTGDVYNFMFEHTGTTPSTAQEPSTPLPVEEPAQIQQAQSSAPTPVQTTTAPAKITTTQQPAASNSKADYVLTGDLNVRTSATTNSKVITVLKKGAAPIVLEKTGNWYKIDLGGGKTGFISSSYVKAVSSTPAATAAPSVNAVTKTVNTAALNVRAGAGANNNVIGVLHKGDTVTVTGTQNGWVKINYNSGTGFVDGNYLK